MASGAVKEQLTQWARAMSAWDRQDFVQAFDEFASFADFARMHFNVGMCAMRMNDLDEAITAFGRSVDCDEWFAIGYMQRGVCLYHSSDTESALDNFEEAYRRLRGNYFIDYTILGLPYQLFACHVILNIALCHVQLGNVERGVRYFNEAAKAVPKQCKFMPDTGDIREAIRYGARAAETIVPVEVSPNLIFRPPEDFLRNAKRVDYLGTAKVVAGADAGDNFTGFSGRKVQALTLGRKPVGNAASATTGLEGGPIGLEIDRDIMRSKTFNGRSQTKTRKASADGLVRSPTSVRSGGSTGSMTLGRGSNAISPRTASSMNPFHSRSNSSGSVYPSTNTITRPRSRTLPARYGDQDGYDDRYPDSYRTRRNDSRPPSSEYSPRSGGSRAPSYSSDGRSDVLKIKCHYTESRIIVVPIDITFKDLRDRISTKFAAMNDPRGQDDDTYVPPSTSIIPLKLKYKDESGRLMVMCNDDDLNEAIEVSSVPNKLEVWCYGPNER